MVSGLLNAFYQKQSSTADEHEGGTNQSGNDAAPPSVDTMRESIEAIWPAFDINGDGQIDREEFCSPGGMAESLLAATTGGISPGQAQTTDRGFFSSHHSSGGGGYPGARPHHSSGGGGYPAARPQQQQQHQAYVPTAKPVASSGMMAGVYNPHAHQQQQQQPAPTAPPPPQPAAAAVQVVQPVTYKTIRVQIPPGMGPGQKLKVLTDAAGKEAAIVTIPDRAKWRANARKGQPFFDIRVAEKPKPASTPVVVQGHSVSSHGGHSAGASVASVTSSMAAMSTGAAAGPAAVTFKAWERFGGHSYHAPSLGMQRVPHLPITSMSNVHASGRRRALLIGINYKGTRAALRGCVNDANNMERLLVQHGFPRDSCHMVKLVDDSRDRNYLPTRANITKACQWLLQGVSKGDVLFFHYSGHGAQVPDRSGMESDGYNETILPMDYRSGQITDDALWNSLVAPLPDGTRLTSVMDCCHSGTGLDLPYDVDIRTGRWKEDVNPAHAQGDAILFSGCEDSQTSADTMDKYQAGGAMTQSFIKAYQDNPMATYPEFMASIHRHLRRRGFHQRPQLTASQKFDVRSRIFSFTDGIEPNHNQQIGRIKRRHVRPAKAGYKKNNMNDLLFSAGGAIALAGLANLFLDG